MPKRQPIVKDDKVLIPLTKELFAVIDLEDLKKVAGFNWTASKDKNTYYSIRGESKGGVKKRIKMHRVILGITDAKILIDHADGNGLNNRKENLRICNNHQNQGNRRPSINKSSSFKGVYWFNLYKKWHSRIYVNGVRKHLGYFTDEKEAALAYDNAALKYFDEFAKLNLPENHAYSRE